MTDLRQAKIDGIAADIPLIEVDGPGDAEILLVGWGSTKGADHRRRRAAAGRRHLGRHRST